jgi:hypothetical protein|tara:strand:- start:71 stop:607 length:537 start_codon:yes stop_codon:yes gene_type:complete
MEDVMPLFRDSLGDHKPKSTKDLILLSCSVHEACKLNSKWHSRLPIIHWSNVVRNKYYKCYSFSYNYINYATAIWSSPVARKLDDKTFLELRRMAICNEAPKNTATRMISLMIKDIKKKLPKIKTLISYQDTEVHLGTIYKASNWKDIKISKAASWQKSRKRNKEQTMAQKIRWEYYI